MTEAEWNACADSEPMLEFLQGKASERKLRLFAVACCRRMWHLMPDEKSRKAIEIAERLADGGATPAEVQAAKARLRKTPGKARWLDMLDTRIVGNRFAASAAYCALSDAEHFLNIPDTVTTVVAFAYPEKAETLIRSARRCEMQSLASLLWDVFGPLPFRPVAPRPAWLTSTVKQLSEAIYEEKAFDRMPILGDALEESGCDNTEILNHCRQPGKHVRGCWVIDLLTGRK